MDAATQTNYKHISSIRFWTGHIQDEGVRVVCNYLVKNNEVDVLELLDCDITTLGCEFLNKALAPRSGSELKVIKLDHNAFGTEGL